MSLDRTTCSNFKNFDHLIYSIQHGETGMSLTLTKEEISKYRKDGLLFPKTIMTPSKASEYLALLENYEAATGGPVKDQFRYKCHLVFPWINELMRNDGILDIVEDLIGPDIMVWTSHLYPKEPGDQKFISWHQDRLTGARNRIIF